MELYTPPVSDQCVPVSAYANLIKASWILIDIIAGHPQLPFFTSSTHFEVQLLSAVSHPSRSVYPTFLESLTRVSRSLKKSSKESETCILRFPVLISRMKIYGYGRHKLGDSFYNQEKDHTNQAALEHIPTFGQLERSKYFSKSYFPHCFEDVQVLTILDLPCIGGRPGKSHCHA